MPARNALDNEALDGACPHLHTEVWETHPWDNPKMIWKLKLCTDCGRTRVIGIEDQEAAEIAS